MHIANSYVASYFKPGYFSSQVSQDVQKSKERWCIQKEFVKNHTDMLLFQGEIEANTCQVIQQPHVEGTLMYMYN